MNDQSGIAMPDADASSVDLLNDAIAAENSGRAEDAFELLRRSVAALDPAPQAHHLLAAEFMERGETGNAILHFTRALEGAPELHAARLQLGLLWLLQASPAAATTTLAPLLSGPPESAYTSFAHALSALAKDDISSALAALDAGLRAECDNLALQDDMRRLRARFDDTARTSSTSDLEAIRHGLAMGAYASSGDGEL